MLNVRIDEDLKKKAETVLTEQGMTATDAVTALYRFIAEHGRMPVQSRVVTMDDAVEMLVFAKSDMSQLERVYGEKNASTLLANTNVKMIFAESGTPSDTEPPGKQASGTDKR
ncbi:hypothetical protein GJY44_17850 [Salmonella enterica]|nr:hypothetical protein [Salmonella enterica]